MPSYEVTLRDCSVQTIEDTDAYQQEGAMTTFFRTAAGRQMIDSWSIRVASFRTTEIMAVRRHEDACEAVRLRSA
jgi:hypothetical protein